MRVTQKCAMSFIFVCCHAFLCAVPQLCATTAGTASSGHHPLLHFYSKHYCIQVPGRGHVLQSERPNFYSIGNSTYFQDVTQNCAILFIVPSLISTSFASKKINIYRFIFTSRNNYSNISFRCRFI